MISKKVLGTGLLACSMALPFGAVAPFLRADTEDVTIDEKNFPDEVFRNYIKENADKSKDGILQEKERLSFTEIEAPDMGIGSVQGIEFLPNLRVLNLTENQVTKLDVSKNPKLELLYLMGNHVSLLDISQNPELTDLVCSGNGLRKLDLTHNPKLKEVACTDNSLKELDLSQNPLLEGIDFTSNKISKIDLSQNTKLKGVLCMNNPLKELDLHNAPEMTDLYASDTQLEKLDITGCTKLQSVSLGGTKLTSIDFSDCTELVMLDIAGVSVSSIDLSKNAKLEVLYCNNTGLSSLDISNNPLLYLLFCNDNALTSLDLSKNTGLLGLECGHNKLKELDLSACPLIEGVVCNDNEITDLKFGECHDLQLLSLSNNKLSAIDLSGMDALMELSIENNQVTELDLSGAYNLAVLKCEDNLLTKLDVTPTGALAGAVLTTEPKTHGNVIVYEMLDENNETLAFLSLNKDVELICGEQGDPGDGPEEKTFVEFIERLYLIALNRDAEEAGKKYWMDEITSGRKNGADCAIFFLTGPEFMGRNLTDEEFIQTLYSTIFAREPEEAGKAFWLKSLKDGMSRIDVVVRFIDSTEWCNLCSDYAVKSGAPTAKAERPSDPSVNFVLRFYMNGLDRLPDEEGWEYWSLALTNLETTGTQFAMEILDSKEFNDLKLSDEDFINRVYHCYMDRDPEEEGNEYWLKQLKDGASRRTVLEAFAQTPEFEELCAKYGIDR